MSLQPGTRFGPYEVTSPLGAGGMGEVYRATDTNLRRAVAIKVLPASMADAEQLARFQREAEVLASLNHPNIAQVHGLEKSAGVTALVMELVDGPTLADRKLMAVAIADGSTLQVGTSQELFPTAGITSFVPGRDGQSFLMDVPEGGARQSHFPSRSSRTGRQGRGGSLRTMLPITRLLCSLEVAVRAS